MIPDFSFKVFDASEQSEIVVGSSVTLADLKTLFGTVTEITDFDGDVDDDTLQSLTINPFITVLWDSGDAEDFATHGWRVEDQEYDDGILVPTLMVGYSDELRVAEKF